MPGSQISRDPSWDSNSTRLGLRSTNEGVACFGSAEARLEAQLPPHRGAVLLLVHNPLAEFRLGGVDVGAVALGVDERVRRLLRRVACDELAVPAPESRMRAHPDVGGEAPQHAEGALEVGPLFW